MRYNLPSTKEKVDEQVETLVFDPITRSYLPQKRKNKFIKGPISYKWMFRANQLSGKAGAVGLGLWYLAGLKGSTSIKLTGEVEDLAGCERRAVTNALAQLEEEGLITVIRHKGARPHVTLIDVDD